jgi:hypothetical protein
MPASQKSLDLFLSLVLVNKLFSILDCRQTSFGWLRLRLAVSAQHQKSTSLCVPFLVLGFLASLVLAGAKTKLACRRSRPNFFTSP